MSRRPRTKFAAPLVLIAACSHDAGRGTDLSGKQIRAAWSVTRTGDRCRANEEVHCPPPGEATCNPPPPMDYGCAGFPSAQARVVTYDGATCVLDGTATAVAVPSRTQVAPS